MQTISINEVKHRGIAALEELAKGGPVRVMQGYASKLVVLSEDDYRKLTGTCVRENVAHYGDTTPETAVITEPKKFPLRLPVGYSDFRQIIEEKFDYVDKTLFIRDIIDEISQVSLIIRPRRFGKTLNMSMLRYFFAKEMFGKPTAGLFKGLAISHADDRYMQQQGKYPVVFVTFKDIKEPTFAETQAGLATALSFTYEQHADLLQSDTLSEKEKTHFSAILNREADPETLKTALLDLTKYLERHYDSKVIVLMDEYDVPIQAGFLYGYYDDIIVFMRTLFSKVLKDNLSLHKAVLTGILRISKESLFSGLNNIKVFSLLNNTFCGHFGFTEKEVDELLQRANMEDKAADVRRWYNGYRIGDQMVYNPWSIVNFTMYGGELQPYWANTSDNALIRKLFIHANSRIKSDLKKLTQGKSITKTINENIVFNDLDKNETALWSMLLLAGYLKVDSRKLSSYGMECDLTIPNGEVQALYLQILEGWLAGYRGPDWYFSFLNDLLTGEAEEFIKSLQEVMLNTFSTHDLSAPNPEKFYHGFMLGLSISLPQDEYEIKSNRESGYGRYDMLIIPKDTQQKGIILEFKSLPDADEPTLNTAALQALTQIEEKTYMAELNQRGIEQHVKIGLAFSGKALRGAF